MNLPVKEILFLVLTVEVDFKKKCRLLSLNAVFCKRLCKIDQCLRPVISGEMDFFVCAVCTGDYFRLTFLFELQM